MPDLIDNDLEGPISPPRDNGEIVFAAPWERPGEKALRWTISELSLFLEGSELVGRVSLSPPVWTPAERAVDWR